MEPLPKGANFVRSKTLWEIGLHIAGNPLTPYGGNRDMIICVGSGSGESFRPWLRMASGSAILAEGVVNGDVEAAFVNPSALLTQAYRGVGLFKKPLPVRIIASYPSWDRFVIAIARKQLIKRPDNSDADDVIVQRDIPKPAFFPLGLHDERGAFIAARIAIGAFPIRP